MNYHSSLGLVKSRTTDSFELRFKINTLLLGLNSVNPEQQIPLNNVQDNHLVSWPS